MLPEPLNTIAFVIVVPIVVQLFRLLAVKLEKPIPIWAVQLVAGALSVAFIFLNGGFAGIAIPVYGGDPVAFVGAWFTLIVAAWGPVELLYRVVFKALFEKVGLA